MGRATFMVEHDPENSPITTPTGGWSACSGVKTRYGWRVSSGKRSARGLELIELRLQTLGG